MRRIKIIQHQNFHAFPVASVWGQTEESMLMDDDNSTVVGFHLLWNAVAERSSDTAFDSPAEVALADVLENCAV